MRLIGPQQWQKWEPPPGAPIAQPLFSEAAIEVAIPGQRRTLVLDRGFIYAFVKEDGATFSSWYHTHLDNARS